MPVLGEELADRNIALLGRHRLGSRAALRLCTRFSVRFAVRFDVDSFIRDRIFGLFLSAVSIAIQARLPGAAGAPAWLRLARLCRRTRFRRLLRSCGGQPSISNSRAESMDVTYLEPIRNCRASQPP